MIVKNCKSVVVLGMEKVPFERVLGTEVGAALQKVHNDYFVIAFCYCFLSHKHTQLPRI